MADTKSIKGTKTEQNLGMAYLAESTAYTRYTYYAQSATKEQYYHFADIFNETAANELHHAKIFLKLLPEGTTVTAPVGVDTGVLTPTLDNLKVAAAEAEREGVDFYTKGSEVALEEGFPEIAETFKAIATIENHHKERFDLMAWQIENDKVWKSDKPQKWQCLVCGYIFEGTEPPQKCPACKHPYQHFMPAEENV